MLLSLRRLLPLLSILPVMAGTPPPNIVLMMADDMGMGDTSAYRDFTGNADDVQLHTPQMDRLARMGIRFTDAHTPASRCSPTRYGLLTGRYPWRSRLKWWVLFGAQGDPLIESDRPTIASMLRERGYRTAMVGKWHVGLRYRRADGSPAAGWNDADLTRPLHTSPLDHGFDFARYTSRSHGTSGPVGGNNRPDQSVGPGHVHGRTVVGATPRGRQLVSQGPHAYRLASLGSRHSDHAVGFLERHIGDPATRPMPFLLYYPANANHGPHTPAGSIGGRPVAGAARTMSGRAMDRRHDFIHENDVALGRLLDWLEANEDPRLPGRSLLHNTLVIFTSDNGAERNDRVATGPFRSNKGSCYEGGHRVPFLAAWRAGGVPAGSTSDTLIGLQDLYATLARIAGVPLPDPRRGEKGAEDSIDFLDALRGEPLARTLPLFVSDHKEARGDPARLALRMDDPGVGDRTVSGEWVLLLDAGLVRRGRAVPVELYDLATDREQRHDRIDDPRLAGLIDALAELAREHRNAGGHRLAALPAGPRTIYRWDLGAPPSEIPRGAVDRYSIARPGLTLSLAVRGEGAASREENLAFASRGLGLGSSRTLRMEGGSALRISFDRDVMVESVALVAGRTGRCGGFWRLGDGAPLAVYCVDADNDSRTQQGMISDLGVLRKGEFLHLDTSPHLGVEAPGRWWLRELAVRPLAP